MGAAALGFATKEDACKACPMAWTSDSCVAYTCDGTNCPKEYGYQYTYYPAAQICELALRVKDPEICGDSKKVNCPTPAPTARPTPPQAAALGFATKGDACKACPMTWTSESCV